MNLHLMRASTPSLSSLIGALLLSVVVLSDLAQCHVQQQDTVQHQPQQRNAIAASQSPSPTPYSSWQRNANSAANNYRRNPAPSPASNVCDYKMLMENLHDRVSVLVTLDENQRGSLEKIEKKLDHLEISNQARMESLSAQQMDFLKRLDSLEHIQRLTKHTIDELKGETDNIDTIKKLRKRKFHNLANYTETNDDDVSLTRSTRQVEGRIQDIFDTNNTQQQATQPRLPPQPPQRAEPTLLDIANRLDSLSFYTQLAISNLQANVTKLLQQTGNLQRRFNNVYRRNKNGQLGQQAVARQPTFYETNNSEQPLVTSCAQEAPLERNIIKFQLTHASDPFYVLCENEDIFNGDWTVILKRFNGAVNFNRDWLEYKAGFGNLAGEFFIGLDKLHALTASAVHELLIILEDFEGVRRYARYSYFAISGEDEQYAMHLLGAFEGDAGDSLVYHAGSKFSTFDHDNDGCLDCNCAQSRGGGWWFNWCARSNLMGIYYNQSMYSTSDDVVNGIFWDSFHTQHEALKKVKMMIRPIGGDEYRRR